MAIGNWYPSCSPTRLDKWHISNPSSRKEHISALFSTSIWKTSSLSISALKRTIFSSIKLWSRGDCKWPRDWKLQLFPHIVCVCVHWGIFHVISSQWFLPLEKGLHKEFSVSSHWTMCSSSTFRTTILSIWMFGFPSFQNTEVLEHLHFFDSLNLDLPFSCIN